MQAVGSALNIAAALLQYDNGYGNLPPPAAEDETGKKTNSWRILILKYGGFDRGFEGYRLDESWSTPANLQYAAGGNDYYVYGERASEMTSFFAVTGSGTAFDRSLKWSLKELPSDAVLVVSVQDSRTHWLQPIDIDIQSLNQGNASGDSSHYALEAVGVVVVFADLQVWVLSPRTPAHKLQQFFLVEEAKGLDREKVLGPYRIYPRDG